MAMSDAYLTGVLATQGAAAITHIGLVDDVGAELTGGSPAYARKAVTWTAPSGGLIRPNADLEFDVPAGTTVGGWRGYSALTAGTDYGGEVLTNEAFAAQGTYTLLAASTSIDHNAA
jgi:hypothetical protein